MKDQNTHIEKFIAGIRRLFPGYSYGYTRSEEEWIVWHTNDNELTDLEFRNQSGELLYSILWENDIYDVSFEYDRSKDYKEIPDSLSPSGSWNILPMELCNLVNNRAVIDWMNVSRVYRSSICIPEITKQKNILENNKEDAATKEEFSLAA